MTNPCPLCDSVVDNHCLQCNKCNDLIHYECSKLSPYMIIQLYYMQLLGKNFFLTNFMLKLMKPLVNRMTRLCLPPHVDSLPCSPLSPSAPPYLIKHINLVEEVQIFHKIYHWYEMPVISRETYCFEVVFSPA